MSQPLVIAKNLKDNSDLAILSNFANRHGLITGATGTGKTVTLQKMAESFSNIGVPVFLADIKGDLTGLGVPGKSSEKLMARLNKIGVTDWEPKKSPIELWDLYGERGIPVRATVTDLGPLLLSRILNLNEVQTGILQIIFRVASDNNLLMIDFKDLRTLVRRVGENPKEFTTDYGNINKASIGAIQRSLLMLEEQGAEHFFAEPSLAISDLMARDADGRGKISILESQKLINSPKLYSVFLLWLLSSLFDKLPEVGDIDKPKLVFFFDEAHLLFNDIPTALLEKIEQVVRLIRSKGVGIYFVTQNPSDVPDTILGQLGNRVQHALRAFSVKDQKAVRAAAQTMRQNPELDIEKEITELAVGEALVSFLDEKGSPSIVQKASIIAPCSLMGEMDAMEQAGIINNSLLYTKYSETVDRESAHELITSGRALVNQAELDKAKAAAEEDSLLGNMKGYIFGKTGPRGGKKNGVVQQIGNGFVRQLINRFIRTVMNQVFGKRR